MTNSSPSDTSDTAEWILGSLTVLLLIAGVVVLWRVHVATNALVLLLACTGWAIAAWLAWTDRQRRLDQAARDDAEQHAHASDDRQQALSRAISGPDDRLIGDADRDAVCSLLAEARGLGRLTADEHDQRSTAAILARHPGDLRATLEGLL